MFEGGNSSEQASGSRARDEISGLKTGMKSALATFASQGSSEELEAPKKRVITERGNLSSAKGNSLLIIVLYWNVN